MAPGTPPAPQSEIAVDLLFDGPGPTFGDLSTPFTYSVTYADPEGDAPHVATLILDGEAIEQIRSHVLALGEIDEEVVQAP
mgnify:CR=1 FL=1